MVSSSELSGGGECGDSWRARGRGQLCCCWGAGVWTAVGPVMGALAFDVGGTSLVSGRVVGKGVGWIKGRVLGVSGAFVGPMLGV